MGTRYEVAPAPIGRSNGRRPAAIVASAVILLAVVVLKPWEGAAVPASATAAKRVAAATLAVPAPTIPAVPTPLSLIEIAWPAGTTPAEPPASQTDAVLGALTVHSGTWGVGNAGVGPRLLRDEPWADWAPVAPESAGDVPAHIATWPDTSLCSSFPTIYDRPSLIAVTAPRDIVPDWRLVGWWTDGANVASLSGSIRQVSPAGNRGISYLERTDRAVWPPGRYEFHVIAGGRTIALTVCLTRGG